MKAYVEKIFWVAAVALVTLAANAQRLQRDPFQPPADFGGATAANDLSARPQAIEVEIRGILFAGGQSLVNFGGQIIGPGEEVNGYRLLEVGEEHAVFQRGDEIITLSLYPDGGVDADADR